MPSIKPIFHVGLIYLYCLSAQAFVNQSDQGNQVMQSVKGNFDVNMTPQQDSEFDVGRMTIDKVYSGDLLGTGKGQMLSHMTKVKGSAGYVAVEKFSGSLAGKQGSFVLMHTGTMDKGVQSLNIIIIADSGTEELAGISGSMAIEVIEGQHGYQLDYTLD